MNPANPLPAGPLYVVTGMLMIEAGHTFWGVLLIGLSVLESLTLWGVI